MDIISLYEKVPSLENNFTVKFMQTKGERMLTSHWHEHIELLYFYSGECNFTCNGKTFNVKKDDFVIVNGSEIHSFITNGYVDYFCILIYPNFFSDIKFSNVLIENLIHQDSYIKDCINEIYKEYTKNSNCMDMMLKSHAYRLMAYLVRNYTASVVSPQNSHLHAKTLKRMDLLLKYISKNYAEKITTSDLAKICHLCESHFCRFFKDAVGKSPLEYINEYRIEKSIVMLLNTDEDITAIASAVGFDDPSYFSRVFKKIKNITPAKYRQMYYKEI